MAAFMHVARLAKLTLLLCSALLSLVLLASSVLVLHHSAAIAQSGCITEGNIRSCPVGPNPPEGPDVEPGDPPVPPPPDPKQIALQAAVAGYKALVSALPAGVLDTSSWVNLPLATEDQFLSAANQLHRVLLDLAQGNRSRVTRLNGELDAMNQTIATYPGQIEANRAEIGRLEAERDGAAAALKEDLSMWSSFREPGSSLKHRRPTIRQMRRPPSRRSLTCSRSCCRRVWRNP